VQQGSYCAAGDLQLACFLEQQQVKHKAELLLFGCQQQLLVEQIRCDLLLL
jgi:hypothetical protein